MPGKDSAFVTHCKEISSKRGIGVSFNFKQKYESSYEYYGVLHIHNSDECALFDVGDGQSLEALEQNKRTRLIMGDLKIPIISSRVLADETNDELECPHCGREY